MGVSGAPRRLRCRVCARNAHFLTPLGLMCKDHALLAAVDLADESESWLPIRIREPALGTDTELLVDLTPETEIDLTDETADNHEVGSA